MYYTYFSEHAVLGSMKLC